MSLFFPCHTHVFSFFSFYIIFLLCLPLCLSVVSPRGGVCNCWPSRPFWAVKLWGWAVPSAFPVRHNGRHRFPKSNRQISTNPISSAFSGRYFFPCRTHAPLHFPSQIVQPPQVLSHLLCSARYSCFSHFTSFSCCVSRCASPLCLPGEAFATADRPARSEQWSCGGEQFQAPPRWDTTGAIDFPSQIVKSPQILSHLLLVVAIFPLPRPCAIRFPRPNLHKSYLICFAVVAIHVFLILHHFPVVSPVVPLRCVSPGRRLQLLTVQPVLSSEALGASSSKRLPGETQRVP